MATVFETVRSSAAILSAAGVDTPEHDVKLLLAEAFHVELRDVDKAMLMGDDVGHLNSALASDSPESGAWANAKTTGNTVAAAWNGSIPWWIVEPNVSHCNTSPAMRRSAISI